MSHKPVVLRDRADRDVATAIDYFRDEAGADVALAFINALERAIVAIAARPATDSPRYSHELDLPGLRHRPLRRFRHLIFYVEQPDHIEVWLVLDGRRDIPTWLGEKDD